MDAWVVVALIVGFVAFLAYRARGKMGTLNDVAANPKRPARDPFSMGGPGNDLIDPGPTDGGTRPLE